MICAEGGAAYRYVVDATPAVPGDEDGRLRSLASSDDVVRFSIYLDDASRQADEGSLALEDVGAFNRVWTGHFPRMDSVYAFARPGKLLMLVYAERGPVRPRLQRVVVYTRT